MRRIACAALFLVSCSRLHPSSDHAAGGDAGNADGVAGGLDGSTAETSLDSGADRLRATLPEEAPAATFVSARRARLTKLDDEPGLAHSEATIRAHFGGAVPPVMDLQAVPLSRGNQALLLSARADEPKPIVLVVDASGAPLLVKEHPLAGITPPVKPYALAPRQDGGLALFLYDEPTKLIAGRMSAANGDPYAELMMFGLPRCDALSAAWWPEHGWLVVASFPGGMRAQLVLEDGGSAWDPHGVPVGVPWRAAAPATIVIDAQTSSWIVVQHATRKGGDHVVAVRYDVSGNHVGKGASDLGAVAHVESTLDRVEASLVRPGVAQVDVGGKGVEVVMGAIR